MSGGGGKSFDVVIVGARCAGAALAQRLATAGLEVVLLDAARLPSDQNSSTHLIQPPGMDELDELGVGEPVRKTSPALHAVRLSYDGHEARLPYGPDRAAHCLRREQLDALLQAAATNAGAEVREGTRVVGLIRDSDGRVGGVEVREGGGTTKSLRASLVLGADGRNSTVAKLVGAREYLGYGGPRSVYWGYWRRPARWSPHEIHNTFAGEDARIIFPTDGDQLLIATAPGVERAQTWRRNHTAAYLADIRACEPIASHLGEQRPIGRVRGVLQPRYFFRDSAGPGWALLGDAGHHKEFVIGLGITDALRDARELAGAIVEGTEPALERWWRRRDVERIEMFYWSRELGRADGVNALQRLSATRFATSPELRSRFGEIIDGHRPPFELVPPALAARWATAALVRGDLGVVPALIDAARRRAGAMRHLRKRKRLARRASGRRSASGAVSGPWRPQESWH